MKISAVGTRYFVGGLIWTVGGLIRGPLLLGAGAPPRPGASCGSDAGGAGAAVVGSSAGGAPASGSGGGGGDGICCCCSGAGAALMAYERAFRTRRARLLLRRRVWATPSALKAGPLFAVPVTTKPSRPITHNSARTIKSLVFIINYKIKIQF